jgi:putative holliday junction resolvase
LTRLLGIDLGTRRIGLAVADTATGGVRRLATLRRSTAERELAALATIVVEQGIDELVLGLPLNMDGSEGEQARHTRDWAMDVAAQLGRPLCWRDERLTTVRAGEAMGRLRRGAGGGPPSAAARDKHRSRLDQAAAALIAQAELDARSAASADK